MGLRVVDEPEHERFAIYADGAEAGFVRYRSRPGLIALTHTETDEALEGHGLATTLITDALDDAPRRPSPSCPRAAAPSSSTERAAHRLPSGHALPHPRRLRHHGLDHLAR